MDDLDLRDADFGNYIAPAVLKVLEKVRFFEFLDDRLCPANSSQTRALCEHSFAISKEILRELGMDSEEIEDVMAVLSARGACCDCEVLYNVAEESRLKTRYWKRRASELERDNQHNPHL